MGTNYYFRRDDNRTRYFMGKEYALARCLKRRGPLVVTEAAARNITEITLAVEQQGFILASAIDARGLAELMEITSLEDGCSESRVAPTGRNKQGTSLRLLALALDVARWSDGMPISIVSEDRFEDWQNDDLWDENASTAEFKEWSNPSMPKVWQDTPLDPIDVSEFPLAAVLKRVRAIVHAGWLTFPTFSVEVNSAPSARASTFAWRGLTGSQLVVLYVWVETHRGSTVEGGPIPTASGVIANAIDVALRILDDPKLDLPCLSDDRAVLVEYAEASPQQSVRDALRALLTAGDVVELTRSASGSPSSKDAS